MADQGFFDVNISRRPAGFTDLARGLMVGQQMGTAINKGISDQEQADRDKIEGAIKLHDSLKGMTYGNLDYYNKSYRPEMIKRGVPPAMLPEYENVQEMNQGLYKNELMKAIYRQKMQGPQVVPQGATVYHPEQGFLTPPMTPYQESTLGLKAQEETGKNTRQAQEQGFRENQLKLEFGLRKDELDQKHQNELTEIGARSTGQRKSGVPQLVTLEDDSLGWAVPGSGDVVKITGAVGKSKAGEAQELHDRAYKAAQAAMEANGIRPTIKDDNGNRVENPAYTEAFKQEYQKYFDTRQNQFGPKSKQGQGQPTAGNKEAEYQKYIQAKRALDNMADGPRKQELMRKFESERQKWGFN